MSRFTLTNKETENDISGFPNNSSITVSFDAEHLDEVCEGLRSFLKGCGYSEKLIDELFDK